MTTYTPTLQLIASAHTTIPSAALLQARGWPSSSVGRADCNSIAVQVQVQVQVRSRGGLVREIKIKRKKEQEENGTKRAVKTTGSLLN